MSFYTCGQILVDQFRIHRATHVFRVLEDSYLAALDLLHSTNLLWIMECAMNCGCSVNAMALKEGSRIGTGLCRLGRYWRIALN